jgi:hypothetical protein
MQVMTMPKTRYVKMNRIAITIILGSLCLLSGCIEVSYKSEVTAKLRSPFAPEQITKPVIRGNGYPYSPKTIPALLVSNDYIADNQQSYKSRPTISLIGNKPKRRGFTAFKRRER